MTNGILLDPQFRGKTASQAIKKHPRQTPELPDSH